MEGLSSDGERRQYPRFTVKLPVDFSEAPDVMRGGLVADISKEGLCIHAVHSMQIGTELKMSVYVPKEEYTFGSIEGNGKIIWKNSHLEGDWEGYQYGLYLTEMSLNDRERLRQLLTHQEQESPSNS